MNKKSLNWMRFSMMGLLVFAAFAVGLNLWAGIKTNNLSSSSRNLSMGNHEFYLPDNPINLVAEGAEKLLAGNEYNDIASIQKEKLTIDQNKGATPKTRSLTLETNSSAPDYQTGEFSDCSGLIASISDVMGYSIPFDNEILAHNEAYKQKISVAVNPVIPESMESEQGIVIQSSEKDGIKVEDAWYNGVNVVKAYRGMNVMHAYGEGVNVNLARNDGFNVDSAEINGVDIDHVGDDGIQIFRAGKDGLVIYHAGEEGIDAIGDRGNLLRSNSPNFHGLYVQSYGSSPKNPGLYVAGTFYATGTKSSVVKTSQGDEVLFAMESPDVEFMASGTGKLVNNECYVAFDRLFQDAISKEVPLRIILTPKDTWSGLYVAQKSHLGFQVKAQGGEENAEFDWLAIGRRKGYENRPASPFSK
jgi:hypothetical protein